MKRQLVGNQVVFLLVTLLASEVRLFRTLKKERMSSFPCRGTTVRKKKEIALAAEREAEKKERFTFDELNAVLNRRHPLLGNFCDQKPPIFSIRSD